MPTVVLLLTTCERRTIQPPIPAPRVGYGFTIRSGLEVTREIRHKGQLIGKIYLHARMDELRSQMLRYLGIAAVDDDRLAGRLNPAGVAIQRTISMPNLETGRGGPVDFRR